MNFGISIIEPVPVALSGGMCAASAREENVV
jgi:hypothetical protein